MSNIKYLKISGITKVFQIDGKDIDCRPNAAIKPCIPQDEFLTIESCQVCGKHF